MRNYHEFLSIPPTFPIKSIILIVLLKLGLIGCLISYALDSYRDLESYRKCLRLSELSGRIDNLDEVLTMSARMAAITGDKKWEERYRNFEPKLDSAIREALEVGEELHIPSAVEKTNEANLKLVSMENQVFELIDKGQNQAASTLLDSPEYESEKKIYRGGMERIMAQINDFTRLKNADLYFKNCITIIFVLLAVPAFITAFIVILVMIKRYEYEIKKHEQCR